MKAEDWIRDAYEEIGVGAAEQPITASMFETAVKRGNRLMYSVDFLGLGYTTIDSASDEVTIPPYAEEWAVAALAVRLAPQFGSFEVLADIKMAAEVAYTNMLRHITLDVAQTPPNGLPMGSGNQDSNYGCGAVFYPGAEDDLELTEDGGYTELEGS